MLLQVYSFKFMLLRTMTFVTTLQNPNNLSSSNSVVTRHSSNKFGSALATSSFGSALATSSFGSAHAAPKVQVHGLCYFVP